VSGIAWGATALKDFESYRSSVQDALILYDENKLKPIIGKVYLFNLEQVKKCYVDLFNRTSVGKLVVNISVNEQDNNKLKSKL